MNSMNYEVIDNFLDEEYFNDLKTFVFSDLDWYWNEHQIKKHKDTCFFAHCLYQNNLPNSNHFHHFEEFFNTLPIKNNLLLNARLNLTMNVGGWNYPHKDSTLPFIHSTSVFYFNTCNGKTVLNLENNKKVEIESVENRIVIFDSNIEHYAVHQTDTSRRVVLNCNFF